MDTLLKFLLENIGKGIVIVVLTVVVSFGMYRYFAVAQDLKEDIIETNGRIDKESLKSKSADKQLKRDLQQQQLEILYFQENMQEQKVWDLDGRVEDVKEPTKKEKWKRRLDRAEEKLKEIKNRIEDTKKKIEKSSEQPVTNPSP